MSWTIKGNGTGEDLLYSQAGTPSLDLRFAATKSLNDYVSGNNLITFTRASSGTFVGSDGLIKTATTNLLLRSEDLTVSPWNTVGSVTVTADSSQGLPFTGASVYRVDFLGTPTQIAQSFTYLATNYTASVWIKGTAGETIRFAGQSTFEAENYTLTGEWQRLTQAWTATASAQTFNLNTSSGATARTIYVAAPQLEQSTAVGEYIPTTSTINSAPRFDHNPTTGESLGLLVEERRTNLLLRSEEFDDASWTKTNTSISSDSIAAPTGLQTGDTYTEGASGSPGIFQVVTSLTASTVYTGSIYIKRGDNDWYRLLFVDNTAFTNGARAWINLATGAFSTVENIGTGTGVASSITPLANGWYRVSLSTAMGGANTAIRFQVNSAASNGSATRVFNSVAYLWGAQLEAGAFPTSYIPTTTAAVTRNADVASITGSAFSGWYRQDEGTVFAEASPKVGASFVGFNDGTTSNRIRLAHTGTSAASAVNVTGGALQFSINSGAASFPLNTQGKAALAMKASDFALVGNTSSVVTSTGLMPSMNQATIGSSIGTTTFVNGTIRRLTYWPQRLANSTLQQITQ